MGCRAAKAPCWSAIGERSPTKTECLSDPSPISPPEILCSQKNFRIHKWFAVFSVQDRIAMKRRREILRVANPAD
jgi:hypothetical protein